MVIFFSTNIHQRALIRGWYFSKINVKKQQQKNNNNNNNKKKNRPFFKSKLGDGHLLEHGRLLEFLRYVVVRTFKESHTHLSCLHDGALALLLFAPLQGKAL